MKESWRRGSAFPFLGDEGNERMLEGRKAASIYFAARLFLESLLRVVVLRADCFDVLNLML